MDKQYIKMCDCPEIQEFQTVRIGDNTNYGIITNIINRESIIVYNDNSGHFPEFGIDELTWLPGIRQLMKMVEPTSNIYNYLSVFESFYRPEKQHGILSNGYKKRIKYLDQFETIQELWLAFIMCELHNKKWDGEKWI